MGDKAISSDILQASDIPNTGRITVKNFIDELKKSDGHDDSSAKYHDLDEKPNREGVHFGSISNSNDRGALIGSNSDSGSEVDEFQSLLESNEEIFNNHQNTEFTVDEAVDALGFGKFQIKLSLLTGLAWTEKCTFILKMADAMEMMILSILSPALHCDWWIDSYQQAMITTVVFSGMMLSSTLWGKFSDNYGRKMGLILSTLLTFIFGLMSALAPDFMWLLILRGFTGLGIGGVPQSITLYAEFLPRFQRAKCVVLIESFWAIGSVFEGILALFVMESLGWRWLLIFSSLPLLLFTICCIWLPESPRYHVACGHTELAYKILERVARENGRKMPVGKLVTNIDETKERGRLADLFISDLKVTTILVWFLWCANAFSYYGLVLFTTELFQSHDKCHGGAGVHVQPQCPLECHRLTNSDYVDLLWTTLAEFPGLIFTVAIIEWLGRKKTMGLQFLLFSFFNFMLFLCLNRRFVTIFIFIARACISGAFQSAYVYTPEFHSALILLHLYMHGIDSTFGAIIHIVPAFYVYPTSLRAVGLGAASGMARLGAIVTPFVAQVASDSSINWPIGIYGIIGILATMASFLLPIETMGREMKDTHH